MNTHNDLPYIDPVQAHLAHCAGCPTCDNWREMLSVPRSHHGAETPEGHLKGAALDTDQKKQLEQSLQKIGVFAAPRDNETHLEYLHRIELEHPKAIVQLLNPIG